MLTTWSPMTEVLNVLGTVDRLFAEFFGQPVNVSRDGDRPTRYLPVNVRQADDSYQILAPMPGFRPEEVEVTYSNGILTIKAQRAPEGEQTQGETTYLRREVWQGDLYRTLRLPNDVKPDEISAQFENGVLTITVPKAATAQPRRIPITSAQTQPELAAA